MFPHLQVEFVDQPAKAAIVKRQDPVPFDVIKEQSTYQDPGGSMPHIDVLKDHSGKPTGMFAINRIGTYFINWFIAQQTGLSNNGNNFAIVTQPDTPEENVFVGSGHLKVAPSSGFAVVNVTEEHLEGDGFFFELQNVSSHDATLSERTTLKAGLAIFGVADDSFKMFKRAFGQWQVPWIPKDLLDEDENPGYTLKPNEAICFNSVPIAGPLKIDAFSSVSDPDTVDVFILKEPGVYEITWEIPIEASYSVDEVEIVLQVTENGSSGSVYRRAYSPLPTGIVAGTALIETTTFDAALMVVNDQTNSKPGGDLIQIGNYSNLVIHQIS